MIPPIAAPTVVIPCRRCGYNLIGQSLAGGRCPECGTPARFSTAGDQLAFAEPHWVATLALGGRLVFWGLVLGTAVGLCEMFGIVPVRVGPPGSLAMLSADGLWYAGVWLLTTADPSGIDAAETRSSRAWAGRAIPVAVLADAVGALRVAKGGATPMFLDSLQSFADLIITVSLLRRAVGLSLRASAYALATRFATLVRWLGVPLAAVALVSALGQLLGCPTRDGRMGSSAASCS